MNTRFAHQKKFKYSFIAVIALFLAVFPVCVLADTTIITNSVKASASSGGNTASGNGGQIVIGETEVDIFIETVINGETVEYIDEHYEGSDIPDDGIHKETHYESEDKSVVVDTDITVNADAEDTHSTKSSVNSENSDLPAGQAGSAPDVSDKAVKETAAVIEAVARIEDNLEKKEETEEESGEAKPTDAESSGEAKPASAKSFGEAKEETEDVGLVSFISKSIINSITNLFKYVLSIFA